MRFSTLCLMLVLFLCLPVAVSAEGGKVNLNTASVQQLDTLPGIGPAIAGRIVEYREKNGPFRKVEDLMNVRGIGEKKFLQLEDRVTVGGSSKSAQPAKPGKKVKSTKP